MGRRSRHRRPAGTVGGARPLRPSSRPALHGRPELFDLAADPGETRDVGAQTPGVRDRLAAELKHLPDGKRRPNGVDATAAERLGALGYVGTVRERGGGPLPNPRDMLPQLNAMREGFRLAGARRFDEAVVVLAEVV